MTDPLLWSAAGLGSFLAFTLSASAGMGGSLILVPTLALLFGVKPGVAMAALLLAANNVAKIVAYRQTIPLRASAVVIVLTAVGAGLGARILVEAPVAWVHAAVLIGMAVTLLAEGRKLALVQRMSAPLLAFLSGLTSGVSGTSGPLKGIALRNLALERMYLVGAASVVSLAGDATKAAVFIEASLLDAFAWSFLLLALPLMPVATWLGHRINRRLGERAYAALFWTIMGGYAMRLMLA